MANGNKQKDLKGNDRLMPCKRRKIKKEASGYVEIYTIKKGLDT